MRIEWFREEAAPTLAVWKAVVQESLPGVIVVEEEDTPGFLSLRFQQKQGRQGWLGAALKDHFWVGCSSLGVLTEEDWQHVRRACAGVERVEVPRPTPKP